MSMCFGKFELNAARFELLRDGERLPVQPKVLDLILYLAQNRDRLVTKDELFREVWGGIVVTEGALSQAMSCARRLLDDSAGQGRVIRTVHGKGFRFVADVEALRSDGVLTSKDDVLGTTESRDLQLETPAPGAEAPELTTRNAPHLFVALHCDAPELGSARYHLAALDEVLIERAGERRFERHSRSSGMRASLRLPGDSLSRMHAGILRTHDGFFIIDRGSKNGTYVNAKRVERHRLQPGDVIECGRTMLTYEELPTPTDAADDCEFHQLPRVGIGSLYPQHQASEHVWQRMLRTTVPLLILGEAGVGKSTLVRGVHDQSRARTTLEVLDCKTTDLDQIASRLKVAKEGTVCLENLEVLAPRAQLQLRTLLREGGVLRSSGQRSSARLIATASPELLQLVADERFDFELFTDVDGFRREVPALRRRRGDLGSLVTRWCMDQSRDLRLSVAAAHLLLAHDWPNNWHELDDCLETAASIGGDLVRPEHLPTSINASARAARR